MLAILVACAGMLPQSEPLAPGVALAWKDRTVSETGFGAWVSRTLGRDHESVQAALEHILQIRLVETEAAARGFQVQAAEIEARLAEARAAMEAQGYRLEQELASRGISEAEFRKLLGDSLLHERLARADLGLAADAAVSAEQLQAWSKQRITALLASPLPAAPDLALDSGAQRVTLAELGSTLLRTMPDHRLRDLAGQCALEQALPDWGKSRGLELPDAVLLEEVEWRRRRVAENPNYQGATYEALLSARGSSLQAVLDGSELRVAGWLRLYTLELWPDAWFESLPQEERSAIQDEYGAAREVSWLLLHAKPVKVDELDLDLEEAAVELRTWASQATNLEDFQKLAGKYSEHEPSRRRDGLLGVMHRLEPGMDPLLTVAAFAAPVGVLHGPVQVQGGMALLWVHQELASPEEATIRAEYRRGQHADARAQFLKDMGLRTLWDPHDE